MTPEREAIFLAAQHCQGGHSEAGAAIAKVLGVPFPLQMTSLIAALRSEGENPAKFYPWMIKQHGAGRHRFFTHDEIEAAFQMNAPPSARAPPHGRCIPGKPANDPISSPRRTGFRPQP
jgi:hypothetical protein